MPLEGNPMAPQRSSHSLAPLASSSHHPTSRIDAVCKSRATPRLTALLLNAAALPTLARARVPATLWLGPLAKDLLAFSGTPSMMPLGRVLPNCLFFQKDLVHTLPVRRNVAGIPLTRGEGVRRRTASVGRRQHPLPIQRIIQQLPRPLNHLRLPIPPVNHLRLLIPVHRIIQAPIRARLLQLCHLFRQVQAKLFHLQARLRLEAHFNLPL